MIKKYAMTLIGLTLSAFNNSTVKFLSFQQTKIFNYMILNIANDIFGQP